MSGSNTEAMGNGFFHHGVATPISNHRGTAVTVDGEGRNVVLIWLYDHRGGYALLMIDAETGKSEEFPMPYPPGGDGPFAAILSSRNRYYTHFNSHFVEFNPEERAFTFHHKTVPQMAMSMTEDDDGRIWSGTYPNSAVASYNPRTGEFRDYGNLYDQNWRQYPRAIAADDTGWVYFGIGSTASQIISLDPETGNAEPLLDESERSQAHAPVYRDLNGNVYGHTSGGSEDGWMELYRGVRTDVGKIENRREKPFIAGSQGLFHTDFPDGRRMVACSLVDRTLDVEDPRSGETRRVSFDYSSEGAHIMGVATAPDNTICGGTAFPMHFFSFNPETDTWTNRPALGQWNTVAREGDMFFIGAYTHGLLEEWDPSRPWIHTERGKAGCNPDLLFECHEVINRPHMLLAHPNGRTVVLAGTPGYGLTGGGMLFWDRQTREPTLLEHTHVLPDQSTISLASLPGGKLLGGTTTSAGTGGEQKAREAELYIMDMETKRLDWHAVVFPGAQGYTDMCLVPHGVVYGIVDRRRFFVFDPGDRRVVHQKELESEFGATTSQQGPRVFVTAPDGAVYILFTKGVAIVEPDTYAIRMLAESPVPIGPGGDILNGRIYFASGSHVYSYRVPEA
jgi:hypothetical protein